MAQAARTVNFVVFLHILCWPTQTQRGPATLINLHVISKTSIQRSFLSSPRNKLVAVFEKSEPVVYVGELARPRLYHLKTFKQISKFRLPGTVFINTVPGTTVLLDYVVKSSLV